MIDPMGSYGFLIKACFLKVQLKIMGSMDRGYKQGWFLQSGIALRDLVFKNQTLDEDCVRGRTNGN